MSVKTTILIALARAVGALRRSIIVATIADISSKLDTLTAHIAALQAQAAAAPPQAAIDALDAKAAALVASSIPTPPPAT